MILIPKTFDDIAIEHYQLPEVRKIVTAYALMQDRTKQALNEDFRKPTWFPGHVKEVLSHYEGLRIAVLRTDIKDKALFDSCFAISLNIFGGTAKCSDP